MPLRQALAYLAAAFGIGVFSSFNSFTLSLWLTSFTTSYFVIGMLSNTKSFEGTIVSPIAGAWSDRIWLGWLGRRRPFILFAGLLSALLLAITPWFSRLPLPFPMDGWPEWLVRMLPAIVAIFLFTMTFNLMDDIHKALLPDITAPAQRNGLSAWSIVIQMIGQFGILVVGFAFWQDAIPDWAFVATGAIMAVCLIVTVIGVREPPPAVWQADRQARAAGPHHGLSLRLFLTHYRGLLIFCLVTFAYWSGVNAVLPLVSIYTRDILGASVGEAQLLPGLLLLSTTLLALPAGWLGDRFGRRRVISAGYAIMAIAAVFGMIITTREQGALLFLFAGVGNAAVNVIAIPLLADLVERHHVGAATGVFAASGSLAAPLASLLAGFLADVHGPRVIFAMMAVLTLVALALMPGVRPLAARAAAPNDPKPPADPLPAGTLEPLG